MGPVVHDCAATLAELLNGSTKPTLVVGYSAGGYLAARAIELANVDVPFVGLHGYYNLTSDYLLAFYSWRYLPGPINKIDAHKTSLMSGDQDPLEESTILLAEKFAIPHTIVEGATHFTFYDLEKNEPYVRHLVEIMRSL